ncbi:hypothetical protein B4102_3385 [Heyndrickxia sporothermodurans]|uniref:YubB ferredoxin-like domain-containing protein n=1 Tax=Heyndrickxia sporothermodurans TaxID=46224 RepID=A0A150KTL4_9BACI|nr:hypothetical protein [Heyndrickxia sporothermodurans]KYD03467.1 hypothetical protein B4102_3385 [Heyndrickxia sporothermodurans]
MPNWCEGTMKVRGTKDNLVKFLKNGFAPVSWLGSEKEMQVSEDDYSVSIKCDDKLHGFHVRGTHRNFVETNCIEFEFWDEDKETHVMLLENYKAAWGIEAESLSNLSKEYDLDFKIYAFERGMEFNQDIEIVKGEIVKDDEIQFDDYEWECISPGVGG